MAEENLLKVGNFGIFLNGSELPDELLSAVEKVEVEDEVNLPAMFIIRINIVDFVNGDWRGIDLDTFKLGDEVKVLMGIDKTEEIMTGEITALEPTFDSYSYMEIRGLDRLHKLRFGTFRRSFKEMKDSDVASSIASDVGLTPDAEDSGTTHQYLFQNNQSNYEFLLDRAQRIDYELLVKDKQFLFRKTQEDKASELTLNFDSDLERFAVRLKAITQGSKVEVRGWDINKKEEITASAEQGSENSKMDGSESGYELSEAAFGDSAIALVDNALLDAKEAEDLARAKYNAILKGFITGEGECIGNPEIRAGKTIEVTGLGERFGGTYYVTSSAHSFSYDQGYRTKFQVKRTGI